MSWHSPRPVAKPRPKVNQSPGASRARSREPRLFRSRESGGAKPRCLEKRRRGSGRDVVKPPPGTSPFSDQGRAPSPTARRARCRQPGRIMATVRRATTTDGMQRGRSGLSEGSEGVEQREALLSPAKRAKRRGFWCRAFFFVGSDFDRLTIQAAQVDSAARGADEHGADPLGDRLTAGRKILALAIKVRILVPQPGRSALLSVFSTEQGPIV